MSDISPLLTKIASGSATSGQAQALGGSNAGVFSAGLGGGNFWDMIIAQFATGTEGEKKTANGITNASNTPLNTPADSPATPEIKAPVKTDNPLALLQIALSSQTLDANGNVVITVPEKGTAKLQTQLEITNKIINQLKAMVPDDAEAKGIFANLLGKLQAKSDNLQASLSALENPIITKDTPVEEIPFPMLIALGLNPSEISEMTQRITELEKTLGREITVEDIIAGVGGLIPPVTLANVDKKITSTPASASTPIDSIDENTQPTDDLAAQLNAIDVGGEETFEDVDAKNSKLFNADEHLEEKINTEGDPSITDTKVKKDTSAFKENLVNILNNTKSQQGQMLFPAGAFAADTEAQIYQQFGFAPASSLSFGASAQAANLISSPATAGQPHPAAQMVAATLTKAGKDGTENIMTLRLDPPELGNVSVRLQFGKDKIVKAVVTAEKPETYMMLLRDSHTLERALQAAGLETNSNSLTFQLSDNGTFAQNNNGKGENDNSFGGNAGRQDADAGDVIQSTVTWQIDPSSGHVRYNIFA